MHIYICTGTIKVYVSRPDEATMGLLPPWGPEGHLLSPLPRVIIYKKYKNKMGP
jgi:hypothetical protein